MTAVSTPAQPRPLIAFLTAEGASFVGNKTTMLALPWLVLATTGSAARVGVVAFAQTGCYVLVKILGAPMIDRMGRKPCAVVGGLLSAVLIAAVPAIWHSTGLPFAVLVALVAVLGVVQSVADSAKRLMVPDLVDAAGVPIVRVTSLYAGVERLSFLLGTPAAGLMIAALGAVNVLLVDATACLVASVLIAVAVPMRAAAEEAEEVPYVESLRMGVRFLRADRLLLAISALLLITNLIDQATMAVFVPTWVKDVLGDPAALGTIVGAYGLGAVVGSLLFAWLGTPISRYQAFSIALLLAASPPLFTLAFTNSLIILLAVCLFGGLMSAAINPIISSAMFERVPTDMQARVFGFTGSLAWAGIPLGGLMAGFLVESLGRSTGVLVVAFGYLALTLAPFVFAKTWRGLNRAEETGTEAASEIAPNASPSPGAVAGRPSVAAGGRPDAGQHQAG